MEEKYDIAPDLLKKIQEDFRAELNKSELISGLYAKVRDGTATYLEANEFALETGKILAEVYKNNISPDILPDGRMYYNIAQRIIAPTMRNTYNIITGVTDQVQQTLNKQANIGIKPITPELNQNKIDGIVNKLSSAEKYVDVAWVLDEPVKLFAQSIVDDSIRENAEFHAQAGMSPRIIRKLAGGCCDWCRTLAGSYSYPDVPQDVYRRHQRCRCIVDYYPGNGKIQNVHSKYWRSEEEVTKIEMRKTIGLLDIKQQTEHRIQKSKQITKQDMSGMKLEDLRKLAKETAIEYYKNGISGISFGNTDIEKAAEKLALSGSRTSLKKTFFQCKRKYQKTLKTQGKVIQ